MSYRGAVLNLNADQTGVTFPHTISWDIATIDTDGFWSSGDPAKIVIPPGVSKVRLMAGIAFESLSAAGSVSVSFRKNTIDPSAPNNVISMYAAVRNSSTAGFNNNASCVISAAQEVEEGDYFVVRASASMTGQDGILNAINTTFEIQVLE